jgi:hypothetical protein
MRLLPFIILITAFTLTLTAGGDREGKWQFSFTPQYIGSKALSFDDKGEIDFNDRTGWGFGIGYNVSDYITLDLNFLSSSGSYNGHVNEDNGTISNYSGSMYSSSVDIAITYNIIDDAFTPYISANVGSSFVDSGIPTGNIYTGTCYDPFYGYYYPCIDAETHTTVTFNYGAGAGLRYDFGNKLFLKGGLNLNVLDFDPDEFPYFISYQLSIGAMF